MALIGYTITVVAKQDNPYNVLPETDISIRKNSDNTLVNIYADEAGLIPIAQLGAKTDSSGQFTFYADASLGILKAVWTNGGVIATEVLDQSDHSRLVNRNAFGAHNLQSISGLTEPSDLDLRFTRDTDTFIKDEFIVSEYSGNFPNNDYAGDFSKFVTRGSAVSITRDAHGNFSWSYNYKAIVGSGQVRLFISSYGTGSGDGQTIAAAKTWAQFNTEANNGDYTGVSSIHLFLVDDVYWLADSFFTFGKFPNTQIYITSVSDTGRSWLTAAPRLSWSLSGNAYKASYSNKIGAVVNRLDVDSSGVPIAYKPVSSIGELSQRTFFYDDAAQEIYARPSVIGAGIELGLLAVDGTVARYVYQGMDRAVITENIDFFCGSIDISPATTDPVIFANCLFLGGGQDCLSVDSTEYTVFMLDCTGAWCGKDVFNYHSDKSGITDEAVAVEVNCVGFNAGVYKYSGFSDYNTGTVSNNGSTCHDGGTIYRFGSSYWNCQGGVVADVNGCKSINYGVVAGGVATGATGDLTPWLLSSQNALPTDPNFALMVGCKSLNAGITDTSLIVTTDTFVYDELDAEQSTITITSETVEAIK